VEADPAESFVSDMLEASEAAAVDEFCLDVVTAAFAVASYASSRGAAREAIPSAGGADAPKHGSRGRLSAIAPDPAGGEYGFARAQAG